MSDENKIIFSKSAKEAIGVGLNHWKDKVRIDIRTFVPVIGEDGLTPTPKGVSLNVDLYPQLLQAVRDLGEVMSNDKLVARIPKNDKEEVRVGVNTFKNIPLIYIRRFVKSKGGEEEWTPTRKGISIKVDLYPRLLEAIEGLGDEIDNLESGE